jgi:hypothetical protein
MTNLNVIDLTGKTLNELKELEAQIVKTLNNSPVKLDGESEIITNLEAVRARIEEIETAEAEATIENGSTVKFEGDNDLYTVSQWDGKKGWAQDENGAGWYFVASQVKVVESEATAEANTQEIETAPEYWEFDNFDYKTEGEQPWDNEEEFVDKSGAWDDKETEAPQADSLQKAKQYLSKGKSDKQILSKLTGLNTSLSDAKRVLSEAKKATTKAIPRLKPRIVTNYGDVLSVQASSGHYCRPRIDGLEVYESYEVMLDGFYLKGVLKGESPTIDKDGCYLMAFVSQEVINEYIKQRGGIYKKVDSFEDAQAIASKVRDSRKGNYPSVDLTTQATALIDAKYDDQYDFICQAPEGEWRAVLEIIFEGADPVLWERRRESYDPNHRAKTAAKSAKRKARRKSRQKNGGSVYSKNQKLNGTMAGLPLAMC